MQQQLDTADDDFGWLEWSNRGRFARECQEGDTLIQIWSSPNAERLREVTKPIPVLLKQPSKQRTRFYLRDPLGRAAEMPWGRFQRLLKEIGYPRQIKAGSVQLVDPDLADTISRKWNSAARQ